MEKNLNLIHRMASLKGVERQFVSALPPQFQLPGLASYLEWKDKQCFNSMVEAIKTKQAYMEAFVTATFMAQKEDAGAGHNDVPGRDLPEEGTVLPFPGGAERKAELPGGAAVGPLEEV